MEITFNNPSTQPEAFDAEVQDFINAVNEPEVVEGDLCDIVKQHDESMSDDEIEEYERQCMRFDNPFDME